LLSFISDSYDFNETIRKTTDNNVKSVDVYKKYFEAKFLRDVEDFYRHHIISYDTSDSLITYLNQVTLDDRTIVLRILIQVTQCINEELERVQSYIYLPESTKSLLIEKVEGGLIHDYQHLINRELKELLDNNKRQGKSFSYYSLELFYLELTNLFTLINRMPNTKILLIEIVKNHMQQIGINAIKNVYVIALKVNFKSVILLSFTDYY
jgi:hypothetical protein